MINRNIELKEIIELEEELKQIMEKCRVIEYRLNWKRFEWERQHPIAYSMEEA